MFGYGLFCCPSFASCLWCLWLGLGFGLHMGRVWLRARSACPPPFPVPVCGVCVRARVWVSAAPRLSLGGCWGVCVLVRQSRVVSCTPWLGLLCGGACLCARPACSPPFLAGVRCVGVRDGPGFRLYPTLLGWVVGVCFLRFFLFFGVSWFGFVVSVAGCPCPGPCGPCPPIPFLSGLAAGTFFFFSSVVCVCMFPFPFSWWAALRDFVLPPLAGWSPCASFGVLSSVPSGWWVWPPLVVLAGGSVAVGCSLAPPPLPPLFIFSGGGGCLFLPLPSVGWRTHWPAFSVVFRAAVGGCVLLGRVPTPWVRRAMYTLTSAPLPAGLGPGSAGWVAAQGGCLWLWVRGLGLSVSFLLCGAGFNLLGGLPPLLPGARWPRVWPAVPLCGVLVRRLPGCAVACLGKSFRLGSAVPCCAALYRVASRPVGAVALWRAVVRCAVLSCVVPWWVSGGQPGLCRGAECGPECGWLVAGGCG